MILRALLAVRRASRARTVEHWEQHNWELSHAIYRRSKSSTTDCGKSVATAPGDHPEQTNCGNRSEAADESPGSFAGTQRKT